jgi:hypothetical protein
MDQSSRCYALLDYPHILITLGRSPAPTLRLIIDFRRLLLVRLRFLRLLQILRESKAPGRRRPRFFLLRQQLEWDE